MRSNVRRVVLVGFMGAGKSTVGRCLAERLGWGFRDADEMVEAEAGRSVADIFAELGEARFREIEEGVVRRLLGEEHVVIATGGGWAARPGRLEELDGNTLSVWLRVGPDEAVRRAEGGGAGRPLLSGADPYGTARALLAERRSLYAAADVGVDTEGSSVEDVTARILEILAKTETRTGSE